MLRAVLFIVISLVLVTFLRMVVGLILNTMRGMANPDNVAAGPDRQNRPPTVPVSGELKKDPVCGIFVPASTSFQKVIRGEAYHFCSADCRDKYGV